MRIEGRGAKSRVLVGVGCRTIVHCEGRKRFHASRQKGSGPGAGEVGSGVLDRDGLIVSSPGLAEQTEAVPIVTPDNSSESNKTRNGKDFFVIVELRSKSDVWHQLTTRVTAVEG